MSISSPVGAPSLCDKGLNREHGEAYPKGTETVAAPATVSEELFLKYHWLMHACFLTGIQITAGKVRKRAGQ